MKNLLLVSLAIIMFSQCKNQNGKIQSEIDNYVYLNFKDPKSYEQILFYVTDTLTDKKIIERNIEYDKLCIEEDTKQLTEYKDLKLNDSDIRKHIKDNTDSLFLHEQQLKNLKTNKIIKIFAKLRYRSKNSFGALDISEVRVVFNDSLRLVKFEESEK